jgi:hypothetical protein
MKKNKDGGDTTEQEYGEMLKECGHQCQMEYRVGRTSGFARCQERHLEKSRDPERKGICQLTTVKMNRSKKLFCQWHAMELSRRITYAPGPVKKPVIEDANQVGMFS